MMDMCIVEICLGQYGQDNTSVAVLDNQVAGNACVEQYCQDGFSAVTQTSGSVSKAIKKYNAQKPKKKRRPKML
jgi:hypothetical protein